MFYFCPQSYEIKMTIENVYEVFYLKIPRFK